MSNPFEEIDRKLTTEWLAPAGPPDDVLYHYTSAEGALGILGSHTLRGTSAGYMNDTSEIRYGLEVCAAVLDQELDVCRLDVGREMLKNVRQELQTEIPFEVFVTSFTEAADDLSQWRAYGSSTCSYALGFRLSIFSERDLLRLPKRVEYARNAQEARVREAVRKFVGVVHGRMTKHEATQGFFGLLFHLRRIACTFKHPGFAAEREWRSVETVKHGERPFELQVVRGALRPYVTMLAGSRMSTHLPLVQLRVGYSSNREQAIHGARLLLGRYGYDNAHLELTEIPYRS